jgi:hypothetical protein
MTTHSSVTPGVKVDDLAVVSCKRIFFGHQSVGMNVLDGIPDVYAAHGLTAPMIAEGDAQAGEGGGFISHAFIGENEKPWLKIQDFDARLRSGVARQVDVALMKLCYIDITASTDVGALFARYRETVSALERDFPQVVFVHVTVPLMTEQRQLSKLKSRVTGNTRYGAAENAARERFNDLFRQNYVGGYLFDLAAIESTAPDGSRAVSTYRGQRYYHLYEGYASDSGHLNREGARGAAIAWLHAVALASRK